MNETYDMIFQSSSHFQISVFEGSSKLPTRANKKGVEIIKQLWSNHIAYLVLPLRLYQQECLLPSPGQDSSGVTTCVIELSPRHPMIMRLDSLYLLLIVFPYKLVKDSRQEFRQSYCNLTNDDVNNYTRLVVAVTHVSLHNFR